VVIATFETRHFAFTAAGASRAAALQALNLGWAAHAAATGADPKLVQESEDDVRYLDIEPGQCFRDDTLILTNGIATTSASAPGRGGAGASVRGEPSERR
jgi:hypothetical protein